jgi:parallel beta-helix repeat protein
MRVGRMQVLVLAAGGCLCIGAGAATAGSPAIGCGATLTKSIALSGDLLHCSGTALVIGADGITVDLAGHTISGTNAAGSEGIANDGHAGVRIVGGGKITDFRLNGVGMRKAPRSVVRGLTIRRIGAGGVEGEPVSAGIAIVDSPRSQVLANDVANDVDAYQSDGADVLNSPGSSVRGNTLSRNSWNGLALLNSARSRIAGNELDANRNNGSEITGNSATGNTAVGIVLGSATHTRLVGNRAVGNDTGIFLFDLHDSLIAKNSATGNRAGLELTGGQAGSDGNRLTGNTASRNDETGIGVTDDGGGIRVHAAAGNQLSGNVANGNRYSGIALSEDKPGDTAANSLERNTTRGNKGHGIDANPGSIDGGGNRASGNATPPQCENVACAS